MIANNNTTQEIPKEASAALILSKEENSFTNKSIMPWCLNFKPKRPLICVKMMITEVAEVNPEITGVDIKSTKNPKKKFIDFT